MSLDFIREVWDAMRSHIDFNERTEAADTLINLLIDNNYEADEIKEAFRGDTEMLKALKGYVDQHDDEEMLDLDEDFDGDDDW